MRQQAIKAGVLSNPYRYVEAGVEFDHDTPMKWAVPVEVPKAEPAEPPKGRKAAKQKGEAGPDDILK